MKTKRIFAFLVLFCAFVSAYAVSPNLQDVTLTSDSGGTLDFYESRSNMVVFCNGGPVRNGTFYLGRTTRVSNALIDAEFSIEIPMSYGMKTMTGSISYSRENGNVYSVILDGIEYKSSGRRIIRRSRN